MDLDNLLYWILIFVIGLCLPLVLLFIINFTGHSEIIEELAKLSVVLFVIIKAPRHLQFWLAGAFGFLFGLCENFLYLNDIFQSGNISIFWDRFLVTVPMHILTVLIILFFSYKTKYLWVFGIILAIVLHLFFNSIVATI